VAAVSSDGTTPEVVVEALGVAVGIPVTGEDAVRLRHQWVRALTDREATTIVDLDHLATEQEVEHDYAITSLVTMAALRATTGQRINLHAGAVADEDGKALAVIGPSGSGKTTAIGLLALRLGYLSDETVSLDESLRIHPHPKPLSVITDPQKRWAKRSVSPDDAGLRRPPAESHLHRIVLLHRGDDDSGLAPLAPALAIAEVVEQSSSLFAVEHPLLRLAEAIDACGGVWSLRYNEIAHRLDELVGLLDREPRTPPARVHHPSGSIDEAAPGTWRRAPWLDAMEYDDELVVMVDAGVRVLAGLGLVLWLATDMPRTTAELVAETTTAWGEHPEAEALVADALALLADDGLLLAPG
jgi:energy-coupling factor transporter ATP-binding protein EcfA2